MDSFIPSGRAQLVPIVLFICNIFWKGNEILRARGSEQFLTFQLTYTWKQIESCKHLSERVGNSNVESSKKFYCYPWVQCNLIEQKKPYNLNVRLVLMNTNNLIWPCTVQDSQNKFVDKENIFFYLMMIFSRIAKTDSRIYGYSETVI